MSYEFDPSEPCAACRYGMWHIEDARINQTIELIAEYGGQTSGIKERLDVLEANPQPDDQPEHSCGRQEALR